MGDGVNNGFIKPYVSVAGIKDQLKGDEEDAPEIGVYRYDFGDPTSLGVSSATEKVQAYLISYPLFETNLDFNEYIAGLAPGGSEGGWPVEISQAISAAIDTAYTDSGNTGGADLEYSKWEPLSFPNDEGILEDKITISLGDMKNMVSDITFDDGDKPSIVIDVEGMTDSQKTALQNAVRIRAFQIKIGTNIKAETGWEKGVWDTGDVSSANELVFKNSATYDNTEALLLKNGDTTGATEKVEIEVKLANKIEAGKYTLKFNFNWYSVEVKPQDNSTEGTFEGFNLGSYLSNLAGDETDVKFKEIPAYFKAFFPSGLSGYDVSIAKEGGGSLETTTTSIDKDKIVDGPNDTTFNWLQEYTDDNTKTTYNLAKTFNDGGGIKYTITQPASTTVERSDLDESDPNANKITATLVLILPMVFEFTATDKFTITGSTDSYIPIKFEGLEEFLEGGDSNDGVMNQIEDMLEDNDGSITSLKLKLADIKNGVTGDNLYLAIGTKPGLIDTGDQEAANWKIVNIAAGNHDEVDLADESTSLTQLPKIKFLIKESGGGGSTTFYIKNQEEEEDVAFNVNISVVAGISLNTKIDL
jgi:hypothetical protein